MAIDAGIYGQIQQPQQQNPLNALAQAMQIKGYQSQMDKADRAEQQQNKLLELVGSPDFAALPAAQKAARLQGVGAFDQAGKVVESDAKANKDAREAEKFQLEGGLKRMEIIGQVAGTVRDQASYEQGLQILQSQGIDTSKFNPRYDPAGVAQFANAAMSRKDQMEQVWKAKGYDLDVQKVQETNRHNETAEGLTASGQAVTKRGQDMNDARAREANQNGRIPAGYRPAADGTLEFIPGGPADPAAAKRAAPTEFQGKSAIFGARAQEADRLLSGLGTDFSPAGINAKNAVGGAPLIGGALEAGANVMLSDNSQKAEQAQRDFINAVLRLESGAAIGKDEFANAKKQYFPQPGDSAEVIAQKASNRKLQIQGLLGNAGNAPIPKAPGAAGGVIKVTNAADYANVPSGATYTTPDGKTRRKP